MRFRRCLQVAGVVAIVHASVLGGALAGLPVQGSSVAALAPLPPGGALRVAPGSVPEAGWFHVEGPQLPTGTVYLRYRNADRTEQTGIARHGAGPLSFWFRAPGVEGSTVVVDIEALDAMGAVLARLGALTLRTGNAPLPVPSGTGAGRRLVIDSAAQQVWAVDDDGAVAATFLLSGRRIPTASGADQPGFFRVYSKSRRMRYCEEHCGTAEYMVRYQRTAQSSVGLHSLPRERGRAVQTADDLGWPLSHGCSRLDDAAAKALYRWARIGDPVVVIDSDVLADAQRATVEVASAPPVPAAFGMEGVELFGEGPFSRFSRLLAALPRLWA